MGGSSDAVSSEGEELVTNGSFDEGVTGWKVNDSAVTSITHVENGQAGPGVRLATTRGNIGVLNDLENTVTASPRGTTYEVSAWVRAEQVPTGGHLRVREVAGIITQTHQEWFWLTDDEWQHVRFNFTSELSDAQLGVNTLLYASSADRGLLVDGITMKALVNDPQARVGTLTNGCPYDRRGVPECGAYMGGAHGGNTDPSEWEESLNHQLGVRRTYWRPDQVESAVSVAKEDLEHQRLPWISFKMPYSWTDMADGRGDAWTRDLATRLAALDGPVWLALHHEPEGDGDVQAWKRMQERLAPLVRESAPNVGYTVILTGWNQLYGPAEFDLSAIWPNAPVDVAGFDVFQSYGQIKDGRLNTDIVDLRTRYFAPLAEWAEEEGVAWGLAETGYSDVASPIWPNWPDDTYQDVVDLGGVAFSYFDTDLNSSASWSLGDTPAKVKAFTDAIQGTPTLPDTEPTLSQPKCAMEQRQTLAQPCFSE
nr:carbohydrate binding domain-containing protein [Serinicoccus marinus]